MTMKVHLLTLLFPKFEEIEATVPIDLWRRAGIQVTTAGVVSMIEGAHGINYKPDQDLSEIDFNAFDGLFIPGGPGVFDLQENPFVLQLIRQFNEKNKWILAICAAPLLLKAAGCLPENFTAHACTSEALVGNKNVPVVTDKNIITGRGPGAVFPFAFELIQLLTSPENVLQLKRSIHYEY